MTDVSSGATAVGIANVKQPMTMLNDRVLVREPPAEG